MPYLAPSSELVCFSLWGGTTRKYLSFCNLSQTGMILLELERAKYLGKGEKKLQIRQYSRSSSQVLLQGLS